MKQKSLFFKAIDFVDFLINKLEESVLALGVAAMAVNTIAAVISRFIFNDAISFTAELNMIFIVLVTFAGLSYAARQGRHIRMSALYDALAKRYRKILMIFIASFTAFFMFTLSLYAYNYIIDVYESGRILPALSIPVFYIYLWVPIGFFITGLQYVLTVLKNLREEDVYLSTNIRDGYDTIPNEIEADEIK